MYFQLEKVYLQDVLSIALVYAILTIAPFVSESLLGNTPVTMAIFRCLGTFHHKLAQHNFLEFVFNFDVFFVFHVILLQIHVSTYPKNDC